VPHLEEPLRTGEGVALYSNHGVTRMFAVEALLKGEVAPFMSYSIDCGIFNGMLVIFRRRIIFSLRIHPK